MDLQYERAYALYRVNKLDDAIKAIQKAKADANDADALELLEGQVLYRMGRYDDCAKKCPRQHRIAGRVVRCYWRMRTKF